MYGYNTLLLDCEQDWEASATIQFLLSLLEDMVYHGQWRDTIQSLLWQPGSFRAGKVVLGMGYNSNEIMLS